MAPKTHKPESQEVPPANSSSDEGTEEEQEENEVDSSGSEEESESDSGSETDSPSPPAKIPEPKAKSASSHPMKDEAATPKGNRSKKAAASSLSPAPLGIIASKRPAHPDGKDMGKDSKKARKEKAGVVGSEIGKNGGPEVKIGGEEMKDVGKEGKKASFQRLWSEEDEIIILNGMVEYYEKKGRNPTTSFDDFFDFIKGSLHIEVNRSQIFDKIRRMKKKFEKSLVMKKVMNDHERQAFNLSAKLWGSEGGILNGKCQTKESKSKEKSTKSNANSKAAVCVDGGMVSSPRRRNIVRLETAKNETMEKDVPENKLAVGSETIDGRKTFSDRTTMYMRNEMVSMGFNDIVVQEGLELLDAAKKSEYEDRWRQLMLEEAELYSKKIAMVQDLGKLLMEALKAN